MPLFRMLAALALVAGAVSLAPPAFADDAAAAAPGEHRGRGPRMTPEERAAWQAMTPEQRQAKMAEHRAKREAGMTPEQKAEHAARRAKWDAMTPEERKAAMAKRRAAHPRKTR